MYKRQEAEFRHFGRHSLGVFDNLGRIVLEFGLQSFSEKMCIRDRARESGLLDDAASSAAFAREMTALLACMSDPVARDLATADVATRMRMAADNLRGAVRMAGRRKGQEQAQSAERKTAEEVPQHPPVKMDRAVAVLCELALQNSRAQGDVYKRQDQVRPEQAGELALNSLWSSASNAASLGNTALAQLTPVRLYQRYARNV